jgi:hypothetical protein
MSIARLSWLLLPLFSMSVHAAVPTLSRLEPSGGARGATIEVKAIGQFSHWPAGVWVEGDGVKAEALKDKGTLRLTIAPDATPGPRWIRLFDEEGASPSRPFVIGTLRESTEVEPNDVIRQAQKLDQSELVINGKLGRTGDVDTYSLTLKKGQTLVASIDSRRVLGAPMDGVLQVVSPAGFVLAQNDDDGGFDPRIVFPAPSDGPFVVRVFAFPATPDSSIRFAGGDAYLYRLTLTTGPFLDQPFPLSISAGGEKSVGLSGWNLGAAAKASASEIDHASALVAPPSVPNTGEVRIVRHRSTVEVEQNPVEKPQALATPITLSGRIDAPRDLDAYRIEAKKGERLQLQVEARKVGSPLDPILRLLDAANKVVLDVDDSARGGRDLDSTFTPPADGTYRLLVGDLHGRGGERFVYRLTVAPPEPDFSLSVVDERVGIKVGISAELKVKVSRLNGHDRPIEIRATGLPDGVKAPSVVSAAKGDSSKSVTLKFDATKAYSGPFRLEGIETEGPKRARLARGSVTDLERPLLDFWITASVPPPPAAKPKVGDEPKSKAVKPTEKPKK